MAGLLARVKKAFNAANNLSDTYTETPDSGSRAYEQQLIDLSLTIDGELICIGLLNPTWSHRIEFQQSTSVAYGANLPAHVGPIDAVLIGGKLATWATIDQIDSERELVAQGITVMP